MKNDGYMIELGSSLVQAPLFATATSGNRGPLTWGRDRESALRFARQKDAEAFADAYLPGTQVRIGEEARRVAA